MEGYDIIIVGAGPAGLSAAYTANFFKLKALVLEAKKAGGAPLLTYPWKHVDYLGFDDCNGKEFAERLVSHVKKLGVEIKENEPVVGLKKDEDFWVVETTKNSYKAKVVIIAVGMVGTPRRLGVEGENLDGVHYFVEDPKMFSGKKVIVVGGGDSAAENAIALHDAGAIVTIIHRRDELRAMKKFQDAIKERGINILWNSVVVKINGQQRVESVVVKNNVDGSLTELKADEVFIFIGSVLNKEFFERLGLETEGNSVKVDSKLRTNLVGVYAAGDVTPGLKRISKAFYEGELAVYDSVRFLRTGKWKE